MRTMSLLVLGFIVAIGTPPVQGDEPQPKKDARPQAPEDFRIFEKDLAGAYYIARPLMEKYESLRKRVVALRLEIDGARIEPVRARLQIEELQTELSGLLKTIDQAKIYIPGATVHKRTETTHVPIGPDDLLLIDCENVEVRGWDGPDVRCVLEKTVLDDESGKVADDFAGIELVARKGSGKEFFGFYTDVRDQPKFKDNQDMQNELRRFVFGDFLGREFPYITLKGLTHDEGNRQIDVSVRSERGDGFSSSQWRRHARLTLLVPKCQRVGIRGALGRLKVHDLNAKLSVLGQGNRDYTTVFEVKNLGGSLTADRIPIHRIDGVKGDVSVNATAYGENKGTSHSEEVVALSYEGQESNYRNLGGNLRVRFCKANLTIGSVAGRVDVENDFGDTVWQPDAEPAWKLDHRIVSQAGTVTLRLWRIKHPADLKVEMFTECGSLRRRSDDALSLHVRFDERFFQSSDGDTVLRSWTSWSCRSGKPDGPPMRFDFEEARARSRRVADALFGRPRPPGIDLISRAGTVALGIAVPEPMKMILHP